MEFLTCFASINDISNDIHIFIQGFRCSFWETADKNYFGFAAVENISHNNLLYGFSLINRNYFIKNSINKFHNYYYFDNSYKTFH